MNKKKDSSTIKQEHHPCMKLDDIQLKQYQNLRECIDDLSTSILGKDYYNMGMDVYTCDMLKMNDIAYEIARLHRKTILYKTLWFISTIAYLAVITFLIFIK